MDILIGVLTLNIGNKKVDFKYRNNYETFYK